MKKENSKDVFQVEINKLKEFITIKSTYHSNYIFI
jgi:hypothetical protein